MEKKTQFSLGYFVFALFAIFTLHDLWVQARTGRGGRLHLSVRDNGPGVPPGLERQIFLPFFSRRADGQQGMGLGLPICKSLVEHFGGQISASSQLGQGTTFTLRLRRAGPASDSPTDPPPRTAP